MVLGLKAKGSLPVRLCPPATGAKREGSGECDECRRVSFRVTGDEGVELTTPSSGIFSTTVDSALLNTPLVISVRPPIQLIIVDSKLVLSDHESYSQSATSFRPDSAPEIYVYTHKPHKTTAVFTVHIILLPTTCPSDSRYYINNVSLIQTHSLSLLTSKLLTSK